MTKETAEKATNLLEEIKELEKYKNLLSDKDHGKCTHFEIVQHYGNVKSYEKVVIQEKHNKVFLDQVEKIIENLKEELNSL